MADMIPGPRRREAPARSGVLARLFSMESSGIYAFLAALIVLFTLLTRAFLTFDNFIVILRQVSVIGICAFGETLVVIAGGIDLSVGATVALSGVIAAVLAKCDLLIGIDSGPMHVAAAMGRPVVALFGPTDPRRTGPQGEGHEVIFHEQDCWGPCVHPVTPNCGHRNCMMAITPDEVLTAALRILARQAQPVDRR